MQFSKRGMGAVGWVVVIAVIAVVLWLLLKK